MKQSLVLKWKLGKVTNISTSHVHFYIVMYLFVWAVEIQLCTFSFLGVMLPTLCVIFLSLCMFVIYAMISLSALFTSVIRSYSYSNPSFQCTSWFILVPFRLVLFFFYSLNQVDFQHCFSLSVGHQFYHNLSVMKVERKITAWCPSV